MVRALTVTRALGLMLVVFSVAYIMPLITAVIYSDYSVLLDFLLAMVWTMAIGLLMWLPTRRYKGELSIRHGYLLVVAMWMAMPAVATLPLLLTIEGLSFTDAYFETMSGLTTTGATVLVGLDYLPPAINIWRHELNWLGGMGIIVLAVAILPLLGVGGRQLFKAETPGPMKDTALTPRITETARNLWLVYLGITIACIASLKVVGMNWLDAICHAFAAMSLGGFSTHDASVGYFNSPAIEFVLIVFMLLAAMNFATHFLVWREKSLKLYLKDTEAVATVALVLASCLGIAVFLWWQGTYPSFWTALRHASFNLVSMATDCGFASVDFGKWPIFAPHVDAVPQLHRGQFRLHRRRHQDGAHADPVQAGRARIHQVVASGRHQPDEDRRHCCSKQYRVCGAGIHFSVFYDGCYADLCVADKRPGFHLRIFCDYRMYQ